MMANNLSVVSSERDSRTLNGHTRDIVLVTGFEPFGAYKVNASWEAVQRLGEIGLEDKGLESYELIIKELPVDYESVDKIIPELWAGIKPKIMVHCGVSGIAKDVTLEQCAHRTGYIQRDNSKKTPANNCCPRTGPDCLMSTFQMNLVSDAVNSSSCGVNAVKSNDAGKYLCDYTYYTSLSIDRHTAFIHVPPLGKPYSVDELALAIRIAIGNMLKQVQEQQENNNDLADNVIST